MNALITGITGFVGSHLAEHLLAEGDTVYGISRSGLWPDGTEHIAGRVTTRSADIANAERLTDIIRECRPDVIYHLAGQANAPESFRNPEATWRINVEGSRQLFEVVRLADAHPRVLHVSTGNVYGQPPADELPIRESSLLRPLTPYALSKATADLVAYFYHVHHRVDLVTARPFNHIGPRQQSSFAIAHFARQIAEAEAGRRSPRIEVGRLDVERDLTDVRDVVRSYRMLALSAESGDVFNIASGTVRPLGELLRGLTQLSGQTIEIVQRPELMRPNDPQRIEVSTRAIRDRTGWCARVPMETTLRDTLEYWRARAVQA